MINAVLLLALTLAPIPSVELGATVYEAPIGKGLACSDFNYRTDREWVAVPLEWVQTGLVNCGDRVYACFSNGY